MILGIFSVVGIKEYKIPILNIYYKHEPMLLVQHREEKLKQKQLVKTKEKEGKI